MNLDIAIKIGTQGGPEVQKLREQISTLGKIDAFVKLKKDAAAVEASWKTATAEIKKLASEISATDAPTKAQARAFETAKKEASALKDSFVSLRGKLQEMRNDFAKQGINTSNLSAAKKELTGVAEATRQVIVQQKQLASAYQTLQMRPFKDINSDINEAKKAYDTLRKSGNLTFQELAKAKSVLRDRIAGLTAETNGWTQKIAAAQTGWIGLAGTIYTIVRGFGQFSEFAQRMGEVRSIAGVTNAQFKEMSNTILDMSRIIPQTASELAAAEYDIISSGVAAGDAARAVELAAKSAVAGVTDTKTAASVGVGVMNAYGKSVDDLSSIYDSLFQTVKLGVITFPQLSQSIGQVLPIASAAKLNIGELGGVIATLTRSGMQPANAMTAIRGAIVQLTAPVDSAKKAFTAYNIQYGNFFETIKQIKENVGPNLEAIKDLVPDIEGAQGVLSLVQNYKQLNDILGEMKISAGSMEDAYAIMADTPANQLKLFTGELSALNIKAQEAISQALLPLAKTIREVIGASDGLHISTKILLGGIGAAIVAGALWNLGLGQIVGGLAGLIGGVVGAIAKISVYVTWLNWATASTAALSFASVAMYAVIAAGAISIGYAIVEFYKMVSAMQSAKEAEAALQTQTDELKKRFADSKDFKLPDNVTGKSKEDIAALRQKLAEARAYWTATQAQLQQTANQRTFLGAMTDEAKKAAAQLPQATARLNETEAAMKKLSATGDAAANKTKDVAKSYDDLSKELDQLNDKYAEAIDAAEAAGKEEQKSAEDTAKKVIALKAEQASETIAYAIEMAKKLKDAGKKESDDYKKTVETQKKAVASLRDARLEALDKYNAALDKAKKAEQDWGKFITDLQKQLSDAKWTDKRITDEERLSMVYALQAKARAKFEEAEELAAKDAEKNQEAIKAALQDGVVLLNEQKKKTEDLANSNEAYGYEAEQAAKKYTDGLTKAIELSEKIKTEVVDSAKSQAQSWKEAAETIERSMTAAANAIKSSMDDAAKDRDAKININADEAVNDLNRIIGKLSEIQSKDVYVTIHEKKITEAAAGGLMGAFPRLTGYLPGHSSKDDTPALLMRGEYVQRQAAVQKYGVGFMDAINSCRVPISAIPKFAMGGIVAARDAITQFFPHFADGGFVDARLTNKIKKAEESILKFQAMLSAVGQYQGAMPDRLKDYNLDGLLGSSGRDAAASGSTPKSIFGNDYSGFNSKKTVKTSDAERYLSQLSGAQGKISALKEGLTGKYTDMINGATAQGVPDVAKLLQDELQDLTDMITDVADAIKTAMEDIQELINDLKEKETSAGNDYTGAQAEINTTADEDIAAEKSMQEKVKANAKEIKTWNRAQMKAAGFTDAEIKAYFKDKKPDDSIEDLPSRDNIEKEVKYTYRYNADGGMDYYLNGAKVGSKVLRGNTWYEVGYIPKGDVTVDTVSVTDKKVDPKTGKTTSGNTYSGSKGGSIIEQKTGEFYNPEYENIGSKNLSDSAARVVAAKEKQRADLAAAKTTYQDEMQAIAKERDAGIKSAEADISESMSSYAYDMSTLKTNMGFEYGDLLGEVNNDLGSAVEELKGLQEDWDEAKSEWENKNRSSGGSKPRSVSYFSKGGIAGGSGSGDTVPAMLTPREGILNVSAMRALGERNFWAINNLDFSALVPRQNWFADGGIVAELGGSSPAAGEPMGVLNIQFGQQTVRAQVPIDPAKAMLLAMKKQKSLVIS